MNLQKVINPQLLFQMIMKKSWNPKVKKNNRGVRFLKKKRKIKFMKVFSKVLNTMQKL